MFTNKNTFISPLMVFFTTFGMNIIGGIIANLILYGFVLGIPKIFAPDYKAILIGIIIAFIITTIIYLAQINLKRALIVGIMVGLVITIVIPPFPLFEITHPKNGDIIPHKITVRGCGGIPDSQIQVFVITPIDQFPQDITKVDTNGKWTIFPVYIGEPHQSGLEAEIYAVMVSPEGNVYESNHIGVKRE